MKTWPKIDRRAWLALYLQHRRRRRQCPAGSPVSLNDGVVGCWDLDGDGLDLLGINDMVANGVWWQNYPEYVPGILGECAQFVNFGDQIGMDLPAALQPSTNFSFQVWFSPLPVSEGQIAYMMDSSAYGWLLSYWAYSDPPQINLTMNPWTSLAYAGDAPILIATPWHHVVFTINGSVITLYLDGAEADSFTALWPVEIPDLSDGSFHIGTGYSPSGKLDEVVVWQRVLSSAEVSQLYNNGVGLVYPY